MKRFDAIGLVVGLIAMVPSPAVAGVSEISGECIDCHRELMPGLVAEWERSQHFNADVGCYECHGAEAGEVDAFEHEGHQIAIIVSPKDCARCHPLEFAEFQRSHHADAANILGSLDNVLGEVVEGPAAAVSGCKQCHGSVVKVLEDGRLDPATWPNTGIGRINPDGSKGSCAACHSRHSFSDALARQPENCGKCHLGPDHPQKEIYEESKHGIAYYANIDQMNLDNPSWIVGRDYSAAPTCATCHMSATSNLPITHDVGDRISWTLRPPISQYIDAAAKKAGRTVKSWEARRADMKDVCSNCHTSSYVDAHYTQYDNVINLYNDKCARPATAVYEALRSEGLITSDVTFDDKIEWTYFYLWHHEGRRARMGAAMFAPDYTQWHGFFEVAHRFYQEFLPEAREIIDHARAEGGDQAAKAERIAGMINEILNRDEHKWFLNKEDPAVKEARKKAAREFRKRYEGE